MPELFIGVPSSLADEMDTGVSGWRQVGLIIIKALVERLLEMFLFFFLFGSESTSKEIVLICVSSSQSNSNIIKVFCQHLYLFLQLYSSILEYTCYTMNSRNMFEFFDHSRQNFTVKQRWCQQIEVKRINFFFFKLNEVWNF